MTPAHPGYRSEASTIPTATNNEADTSEGLTYDAFLSYSHAVDARLAPALQRGLHRLAKRWYQPRALRVFRDRTDLAANPDLWTTITTALDASRFFILLASPEAASSPWVDREVAHWIEHRERETFLIVRAGGTIAWDEDAGDFDWTRTDALPPRLRGWFDAEPLWVDLAWARDEAQLSVRHSRFRAELATLAAPVHGRDRDELDSEDVRRHRVATRVRRIGVTTLALLLVVAVVLGGVAAWLRQRTVEQRDQALSRELAARSEAIGDSDPELARLLSLAATRVSPTAEARAAMLVAAARPGVGTLSANGEAVDSLSFSPDGSVLATTGDQGRVRLWDVASRRTVDKPRDGTEDRNGVGHQEVAFSPDGRTFAAASANGGLWLWDVGTDQPMEQVRPHDLRLYASGNRLTLAFSPDGRTLALGTTTGEVELWDVGGRHLAGAPLAGHGGEGWRTPAVAFSPDGRALATAGNDGTVRFWDVGTRRPLGDALVAHPDDAVAAAGPAIAFTPDGTTLATAGPDGATRLWDVATRRQVGLLTGYNHPGRATLRPSVAFGADGRMLATGSNDGTVRLWNVATRQEVGEPLVGHTRPVDVVAFAPDGRTVAGGGQDGTIRLWDVGSHLQDVSPLSDFTGPVHTVSFSPDGRTLAAGGDSGAGVDAFGDRIRCGYDSFSVCSHSGNPRGRRNGRVDLRFPEVDAMVARQLRPVLVLWDVGRRERLGWLGSPDLGPVLSVAFGPDGRTIALGGAYVADSKFAGKVVVWDVVANRRIGEPVEDTGPIRSLAFIRDGSVLVGGTEGDLPVRLWDTGTWEETGWVRDDSPVYALALSPDGRTAAAAQPDGSVPLWSVETRQQVGALTGHAGPVGAVAFSPDGRGLVTAGEDGTVRLWDATTHTQVGEPFVGHTGPVHSVAFSPDGWLLATGSVDGSVRLWDVATRKQVSDRHLRHHGPVRSVAFSPDGATLASGGEDRAVRLWDVGYARDVEAALCASVDRSLTPQEWARHVPDLPPRPLCP